MRLLLVEDSENDAMLLLRELRRGGYEPHHERVYTPEGMERALEEARGEPYEVVISDYYMPSFRAPDALAILRGLGHDVPFIVVSGKIGEDAAVEIMKAGANDYLTKENMARLCPAVGRVLGFAPEERVGLDALGLIHPEDRDRVAKVLEDRRDVPGPFPSLEYRVRDKQGSWRHLEAVGEDLLRDPAVGASSSTPATSPGAG